MKENWFNSKELKLKISINEFQMLMSMSEEGLVGLVQSKKCLILRDKANLDHRGTFRIEELQPCQSGEWILDVQGSKE